MEYQKIANLLDGASSKTSTLKIKMWVEITGKSRGTYNVDSQINFKTTMLKSSLCDYSDAYIHAKGKIAITRAGEDAAAREVDECKKDVAFKNCAPYTVCIIKIK